MTATLPEALALAHAATPAGDGDAPPLVIAHGLFGSGRNWASLAKKYAADRAVWTVDLRNHGDSPWDERMDYEAMAADLLAFIDVRLGGRATLLGHSMGGKAAMAAALVAPDRVAGLIVADMAPIAYRHSHALYIAAMRGVDLRAVTRRSEAEPMLAHAIEEPALRAFILQNLVIEQGRARWRLNLDAIDAAMPALLGWPERFREARYDGPTFFYHGGASEYFDPPAPAAAAAAFPAAEIDAMPGAGHWLHAERPDLFLERTTGWLAAQAL